MQWAVIGYLETQIHEGWKGFYDHLEPLQLTLWNISTINKITSPTNKVFVFENPSVFSEVLYQTKTTRPSLICTFGNTKLSTLVLLDKLVEEGTIIYYSEDFDPEGLLMADKLKQRYKKQLILWRYGENEYFLSQSQVILSSSRLQKLNNIKDLELQKMSNLIKEKKYAAYQELLIDLYLKDIINM